MGQFPKGGISINALMSSAIGLKMRNPSPYQLDPVHSTETKEEKGFASNVAEIPPRHSHLLVLETKHWRLGWYGKWAHFVLFL